MLANLSVPENSLLKLINVNFTCWQNTNYIYAIGYKKESFRFKMWWILL